MSIPPSPPEIELGPSGRIILQDLNVALSSNFRDAKACPSMSKFIATAEEYRQWLVDLLQPEFVILCTARSHRHREATLTRIAARTGWIPQDACFNQWSNEAGDGPLEPHQTKERFLVESIFPRYGATPSLYFAIDSFLHTRTMYRSYGIECRDANRNDSRPWSTLVQEQER